MTIASANCRLKPTDSMAEYINGSTSTVAVFLSVFILTYFIIKILQSKKPQHILIYPPALPSIPILGSFPLFKDRRNIHQYFAEEAKRLGSVFSYYQGSEYTIVLNDRTSIHEALLKKSLTFADRAMTYTQDFVYNPERKGLISRNYDADCRRLQKLILGILKTNFGLGQKRMEQRIETQIEELIVRIREFEGRPFDPSEKILNAMFNITYSILFGKTCDQDDPEMKHLGSLSPTIFSKDPVLVHQCPILRYLPSCRNSIKVTQGFWDQQTQSITDKVRAVLDSAPSQDSFVWAYVQRAGPDYDPANLVETIRNMANGGGDTVKFTVMWALILLANNPELQKRIQDEIDSVVPTDRLPCISDMANLPLTEATMLEVMRFKTLVPLSVARRTQRDTEIAGYHIPKGTVVKPNIYAVHMDKGDWGDPEIFRPERFLDESGLKVVGRDRIMPFCIGKRSCMGEGLARPQVFLLISSLSQQFSICPGYSQDRIDCDVSINTVMKPTISTQMRMIPRRH